jgi:hypothetical protein
MIAFTFLLVSCGTGLDIGDGKGGDCQPCNANRVCDAGLSCSSFSGGKELCAKPSTKTCTGVVNPNNQSSAIQRMLEISSATP